jgi:hypothetical protein
MLHFPVHFAPPFVVTALRETNPVFLRPVFAGKKQGHYSQKQYETCLFHKQSGSICFHLFTVKFSAGALPLIIFTVKIGVFLFISMVCSKSVELFRSSGGGERVADPRAAPSACAGLFKLNCRSENKS